MPELGGINATFAYVAAQDYNFPLGGEDWDISGTFTAGATGKWGPVEVIAAYTKTGDPKTSDGLKVDGFTQWKAGVRYVGNGLTAAYQFEDVDLGGSIRVNGLNVGSAGEGKFNFVNLGYKFGNTLLAGNYGKFSADGDAQDVDYLALGATYFFDKKVRVYGGWANTDTNTTTEAGKSGKYDTWGAGIRYDF
jgi:predicted porin